MLGGPEYIRKIHEAIWNAQRSVFFVTFWERFRELIFNSFEPLQRALNNGAKIRMLVQKPKYIDVPEFIRDMTEKRSLQVRYTQHRLEACLNLIDKKMVFVVMHTNKPLRDSPVLWSDNPSIVAMGANYFREKWEETK